MNINLYHLINLILIDIFGLNLIWNERFDRRFLHHLQRNIYNKRKKIIIYPNQKLLVEDIKLLDKLFNNKNFDFSFRLDTFSFWLSKSVSGNYSKKSTISFIELDVNIQNQLIIMAEKYIPHFEKLINQKLYLNKSNDTCFILRYSGINSNFSWHYDNEDSSCYRALFLFHKCNKIPDFIYYDNNKRIRRIKLDIGDGFLFKGKYTYHSVDRIKDDQCERFMISFQYTTNPNNNHKSFCSEIGQKISNLIYQTFSNLLFYGVNYWFIENICTQYLISINNYYFMLILLFLSPIIVYLSDNLDNFYGSHYPYNITLISKFIIFNWITKGNLYISILYSYYIFISELLIPHKFLSYF